MSMNSFIGTAKNWILGSKKVDVDEVVPTADVQTVMIYDEGRVGQALKGVATEEFWLNPPYGRPRNIDYTSLEQFEESVWVQICTDAKVDAVVGAEWVIVPRKKLERDEKPPEQAIEDMRRFFEELPSEETFGVCLAEMIPDLEWYDAGVVVKSFPIIDYGEDGKLKEGRFPVDLHVLDGRSFMIEAGVVGGRWKRFWQYSWINPSGIPTAFDVDEVMYFRMRPSSRGFYGTAKLEIIQDVINYLMDSTDAQSKLFENGLFIGGQIDHPDIKDVKELQRKAQEYKKNLQGPKKAGKWLVTGGGVKVTGFPFNPEQMQWLDGQKWFAKLVLSVFKIAPSEIGWTEDLNRATGMQQMNIHKSRAVRPLLKCIEDVINTSLIWKKYPDIRFKFISSLDLEDTMKQAQIDEIYTRMGKVTINELRERDGETILDDEKFDSPFADQPEPAEEEDEFGGWSPFDEETGDTTESEEDETFKIGKGGKGSGMKGHRTAGKPDIRSMTEIFATMDIGEVKKKLSETYSSGEIAEMDMKHGEKALRARLQSIVTGKPVSFKKMLEVMKAVSVGAMSGEPGYAMVPKVVDGKIETKKIEDDAEKELKEYWAKVERDLKEGLEGLYSDFGKGGPGSGIKGHRTAEKERVGRIPKKEDTGIDEIKELRTEEGLFKSTADAPAWDNIFKNPEYHKEEKNITADLTYMSPMDYLRKAVEGSDTTIEEHVEFIKKYRSTDYAKSFMKGDLFPIPWFEHYVDGTKDQEGNHRAMALQLLIEKDVIPKDYKMPVIIVKHLEG